MWEIVVKWLLHFSNAAFITGINLLIHTTVLIGICLACRSVVKRKGRKAATQSVVLRACLVAALLSPLTLSLFAFTGMNTFFLSTTLLNPPEYSFLKAQKSISSQSSPKLTKSQKPEETVTHENTQQHFPATDTIQRTNSPVKKNERIKVALPTGKKHPELTSPGSVEKNMEDHTGKRKTTISPEKIIPGLSLVFTGLWCFFSMFLFVRFIAINLYIRRIRQLATEAKPAYRKICRKAAVEFGIKPPAILQSCYVHSTMITGFFKPSIILPAGENEVPMASREVFLHELAHLARRDYLWNQFGQVGKIILPFQPLIWILAQLIEEISDYVCDDYVVKFSTVNRSYAVQLFNLALSSHPGYPEIQAGAGIVSTGSPLRRRIERILDNSYARHVKINANEAMSITLLFVCSITFTGFIGVDRPGILPHSRYVTQQSKDDIKTHAVNSFTVKQNPDTPFSSGHVESHMTESDSDKEHVRTDVEKSTKKEDVQVSKKLTGYNEKQGLTVSYISHAPDPEKLPGIIQVNDIPAAEADMTTESTKLTAEARPEIENIGENSTGIQATEPETVTMIVQKQDLSNLSSFPSQAYLDQMSVSSVSNGEINDLALKAVDVRITYDFNHADLSDPEEIKKYNMFRSLSRSKMHPAWSPDGKWIAFSDNKYGVWMVPAEGGEPKLVYDNYYKVNYKGYELQIGGLETLGFTPDGSEITFLRYAIDEKLGTEVIIDDLKPPVQITVNNPIPVIVSVNITNGLSRVIARNATSGRWSYDGRYFTYARKNADSFKELVITDTFTGLEKIIDDLFTVPIYFPMNDAFLLFSESDIYRVEEKNGVLELLEFDENAAITDISPDGKWILYTKETNGRKQEVYNTETSEQFDVFSDASIQPFWAKFSPDGTKICFCLNKGDSDEDTWEIYLYDAEFSSEQPLDVDTQVPLGFDLTGNFPNPFNASTTITFTLPENGFTSLDIYNIMGQKVRELLSEQMTSGVHTIVWDGSDDSGRRVSSGTYITILKAGINTAAGRMMLVK